MEVGRRNSKHATIPPPVGQQRESAMAHLAEQSCEWEGSARTGVENTIKKCSELGLIQNRTSKMRGKIGADTE